MMESGDLIAWDLAGARHLGRPFDAGQPGPVTTRVPVTAAGTTLRRARTREAT